MYERHIRIVMPWVHMSQEAEFEAFEREAARIMARTEAASTPPSA